MTIYISKLDLEPWAHCVHNSILSTFTQSQQTFTVKDLKPHKYFVLVPSHLQTLLRFYQRNDLSSFGKQQSYLQVSNFILLYQEVVFVAFSGNG